MVESFIGLNDYFCIFAPMKHTYYPQGTCSQVIEFEIAALDSEK